MTHASDLFAALHRDGEHISICHQAPGGTFAADVVPAGTTALLAVGRQAAQGRHVWHSVNPVRPDVAGRGTAGDVTRLAALWADLDVKPGAMPTLDAAQAVITDLATMLGSQPQFVVHTGHGLHPYWILDDTRLELHDDDARAAAVVLLRRWARLAARVAAAHGGTVDAVFDLPRVLRTPGTTNVKTTPGVPVDVEERAGYPLDLDAVLDALDGAGEAEWPEDRDALGDVVAPRADWPASLRTCGYVRSMIDAWATDVPARGRHHWSFGQLIRLACARRLGCITDSDFAAATRALQARLDQLRAHDGHRPGEVAADLPYAYDIAQRKTTAQARAELGGHGHEPPTGTDDLDGLIAPPAEELRLPQGGAVASAGETTDRWALLIADEARKLRIRDEARELYARQKAEADPAPPFDDGLLVDILARPAEPPHRVDELMPADGSTLLVAQRKTGKTTWLLNLVRALVLGGLFLGRFAVQPVTGRVGFLNFEVSAAQLARWAHEHGVPADRLYLVNLRGRRNPLDHPADRAELAARLREHQVETLIVDPFGRAYTGTSQNDAGEVGSWLVRLDAFARADAGVRDLVLAAHAGWNGERTRGASALEDWADSIVTLTRGDGEDSGRYMRAIGRDVDLEEDALTFDPTTRTLTLAGTGSRADHRATQKAAFLISAVHGIVSAQDGATGGMVEAQLRKAGVKFQKGDERKALALAVEQGLLTVEPGRNNQKHYHAVEASPASPKHPRGDAPKPPRPPSIRGGLGRGDQHDDPPQQLEIA